MGEIIPLWAFSYKSLWFALIPNQPGIRRTFMKYALAFALSLLCTAASAQLYNPNNPYSSQTITTVPLGGGFYSHSYSGGGTGMSVPLGGGFYSHTFPDGSTGTTVPLGNGWSTTTINPSYRPYGYR
jgi:hypothetical protein